MATGSSGYGINLPNADKPPAVTPWIPRSERFASNSGQHLLPLGLIFKQSVVGASKPAFADKSSFQL